MNVEALKDMMKKKGVSVGIAAAKLGIDPATFYRKISGITEFTRKEIVILRELLSLSLKDVCIIFLQK